MKTFASLVFTFSLLVATLLPTAALAQSTPTCSQNVIVAEGDTLMGLAARYLNLPLAYTRILDATNAAAALDNTYATIGNESLLMVGWKLCIPGLSTARTTEPAQALATATPLPTPTLPATTGAALLGTGSSSLPFTPPVVATSLPSTPPSSDSGTTAWSTAPHPLQIEVMRQHSYPGSSITFEQTLEPGVNYSRYVVSYLSDGLKIYALMTIPNGTPPASGWPSIVFNHGYIAPSTYRTTERYVAYVDAIASAGYIVLKIDFRGHGSSDGEETVGGGYGMPDYTNDAINALASLQSYPDADPNRIGMWGHSMGGQVVLRAMVVSPDIKAGVIWAGSVAPYPEIIERWGRIPEWVNSSNISTSGSGWGRSFGGWIREFTGAYGRWDENPSFWATISPNSYLGDLSGPLELHHSTTDEMVPLSWSETLARQLEATASQPFDLYTYAGDNHNISANFNLAMQRTVEFFDAHVKNQ